MEPDDGEKRLLRFCRLLNERHGAIHDDTRGTAFEAFVVAIECDAVFIEGIAFGAWAEAGVPRGDGGLGDEAGVVVALPRRRIIEVGIAALAF